MLEPSANGDPKPIQPASPRRRAIFVNSLIVLATVLAIIAIPATWANRLLFSPDNWEHASTQLLENQDIRSTSANYMVDQLYGNVNVAGLIKSALPKQIQGLAGPAAGALRNGAVQGAELALTRPRVQTLWAKANRAADQAFIALVNGGTRHVRVKQGVVTLNLGAIVDDIAARLGLPAGISAKFPPNIANLTVMRSNQIKLVQVGGNAIRHLAFWLFVIAPVLYALALVLARGRRRTTFRAIGFTIVLAGVIGLAGRAILESSLTNSLVSDATLRPAVRAVVAIGTSILGVISGAFVLVGLVLVAAAWFAGPSQFATVARRAITPVLREQAGLTFATVGALMVLIFVWEPIPATGKPAGIVVFSLLALLGTELLRRQTAVEFPDARRGDTTSAISARWQTIRDRRRRANPNSSTATTLLSEQLERLATLRDQGALTHDEYDTAKDRLLHVADPTPRA